MNKEDRDKKRRQKAIERVKVATQDFETEMNKAEKHKDYYPDLDDLEKLAKCFENIVKCMKGLNKKADKARKEFYEDKEGYQDII